MGEESAARIVEKRPFQGSSSSSASSQVAGGRGRCIDGVTYQSSERPDSSSHAV
jgi:hypothetical protein